MTTWECLGQVLPHRRGHHYVFVAMPEVNICRNVFKSKSPRAHEYKLIQDRSLDATTEGFGNVIRSLGE